MRILRILTVFFALSLFACIANREPASPPNAGSKPKTERTNEDAPVPTRGMAFRHPGSLRELGLGHSVYMRKCGECHYHKLPDEVKSSAWHIHVPGMAWNAGIEPYEQEALLLYLQAASKDAEAGR
jgi:hypothetical protein